MYVCSKEEPGGLFQGCSVAVAASILENPPIPKCLSGLPAWSGQALVRKEAFPWISPLLSLHDYYFECQTQP